MQNVDFTLIIPSLNPDEKLAATVNAAIGAGIDDIILVDDGSAPEHRQHFTELEALSEVTLLTHPVNRGKGAALKTAFTYFLENRPEKAGVVTADGDGQHKTEDIIACAEEMTRGEHAIVLGCRNFMLEDVPPRSRFGNTLTSNVFRLLCGMKISDTQTGLRAIPTEYLGSVAEAEGSRYEYETNMLLLMNRRSIPYREVSISTVYIDDNAASHFRPIRDSLRVYGIIFKYIASSLFASLVDLLMFYLLGHIVFAGAVWIDTFIHTALARIVSSSVNFAINRRIVFGTRTNSVGRTYMRYACVAVSVMLASWITMSAILSLPIFGDAYPLRRTLIKIPVDTILFIISFRIQQKWVFSDKHE